MSRNWSQIIKSSKSQYSFYCISKDSGKVLAHDENRAVETASTIKLLIMAYAMHQAEKGAINFRTPVKVTRKDVGGYGSGILQHFYLHKSIELYNLIVMMMTVSDNVATNVLIRILGKSKINSYAHSLGLEKTKLKMDFISFTTDYVITKSAVGISTAKEMATLVDMIISGKLLDKHHTSQARSLMHSVQASRVVRRLPFMENGKGTQEFGSKPGSLIDWQSNYTFSECGFFVDKFKREHIFSIYASGKLNKELPYSPDSASVLEFVELSRALYDELEGSR